MNGLLAALLASGEIICEFNDGYRRSLIATIAGDPPRTERVLVYRGLDGDSAEVLASGRVGRRPVLVRRGAEQLYLIEPDGPSLRVTTLGACLRNKVSDGEERCTRFTASHAWHFDAAARFDPDTSYVRQPSGSAAGFCEPWKVE